VVRYTVIFILLLSSLVTSSARGVSHNTPKVVVDTNFGEIALELFDVNAPVTVDNFLHYVNTDFYDGLAFHRIIEDFMIQSGGYYVENLTIYYRTPTRGPIINESYNGLSNIRGTIAMARGTDPNSARSQFYINHVDNLYLDRENDPCGYGYCVFGRVLTGMDVVDAIAETPVVYVSPNFTHFPWPDIAEILQASIAPPGYWLEADLDNSGIVDLRDFAILASNWEKTAVEQPGDLDGDGTIDLIDLEMFASGWLQTATWYTD